MMFLLQYIFYTRRIYWLTIWLIAAYILTIVILLQDYLPWHSVNFILGISMLPFTMEEGKASKGYVWGIMALLFAIVSLVLPVSTIVFFSLICGLLVIVERWYGKLTMLPVLTLLLMTPIVHYAIGIFSFPIRLQLTIIAGNILRLINQQVIVAGNVVTCNGHDYSVDPACMGLKMLLTSLLCGVLIIIVLKRKAGRQISTFHIFFLLAVSLLLNIVANLSRIVILVYFNILPDHVMHELTGIACLIVYILLPFIAIVRWWIVKYGKALHPISIRQDAQYTKFSLFFHSVVIGLVLTSTIYIKRTASLNATALPVVSGYTSSFFDASVLQFKNDRSLVYIKKINGFYYSEHNPMICWVGSGYMFESISEQTICGLKLLTGVLKKGNERLYTAWWYDNGVRQTISQLEWRWDAATGGGDYSIVNITTENSISLQKEIANVLRNNVFKDVLMD